MSCCLFFSEIYSVSKRQSGPTKWLNPHITTTPQQEEAKVLNKRHNKLWTLLRRLRTPIGALAALVAVCTVGVLVVSCANFSGARMLPPVNPGATFVGNETCEACHEAEVKNFPRSAHARIHVKEGDLAGLSGCETCHGPGSAHVEADGGHGVAITNPGKSSETCYRCHFDKEAEFSLPYRHPLDTGKMTCSDCHDPHGPDARKPGGMAIARVNDVCAKCHSEQTSHRMYVHEALGEGCTSCHAVHGSINKKMLLENDNNLCLKCHAQIPDAAGKVVIGGRDHSSFLTRGTCWSAGCHTAVHGSKVDSHLRY